MKYVKKLVQLFGVFFLIGIQTFGGGLAMLPILESELVTKRHWTTQEKLLDYFAIGQATPGIIAVNVSTFLGYSQAGILGGIMGTLGIVAPSIVIIEIIALFFKNFGENVYIQKALIGINVAVGALLLKVFITFLQKSVLKKDKKGNLSWKTVFFSLILVFWGFTGVTFFRVNTAWVMLSGIGAGLLLHFVTIHEKIKLIK
jgi:chromate transporter